MMLQFKQAVKIGRKVFPLGIHEVSEAVMKDPHFALFKKAGSIVVPGAADTKK